MAYDHHDPKFFTGSKAETVEMLDGRRYLSMNNWEDVFKMVGGKRKLVTDQEEADRVRFIAIAQSSGGPG